MRATPSLFGAQRRANAFGESVFFGFGGSFRFNLFWGLLVLFQCLFVAFWLGGVCFPIASIYFFCICRMCFGLCWVLVSFSTFCSCGVVCFCLVLVSKDTKRIFGGEDRDSEMLNLNRRWPQRSKMTQGEQREPASSFSKLQKNSKSVGVFSFGWVLFPFVFFLCFFVPWKKGQLTTEVKNNGQGIPVQIHKEHKPRAEFGDCEVLYEAIRFS